MTNRTCTFGLECAGGLTRSPKSRLLEHSHRPWHPFPSLQFYILPIKRSGSGCAMTSTKSFTERKWRIVGSSAIERVEPGWHRPKAMINAAGHYLLPQQKHSLPKLLILPGGNPLLSCQVPIERLLAPILLGDNEINEHRTDLSSTLRGQKMATTASVLEHRRQDPAEDPLGSAISYHKLELDVQHAPLCHSRNLLCSEAI